MKQFGTLYIQFGNLTRIEKIPIGVSFEKMYINDLPHLEYIARNALFDSAETLEIINYSNIGVQNSYFILGNLEKFTSLWLVVDVLGYIDSLPLLQSDSVGELAVVNTLLTTVREGQCTVNLLG